MSSTRRRGPAGGATRAGLTALTALGLAACTPAAPSPATVPTTTAPATARPPATAAVGRGTTTGDVSPDAWSAARRRAVTDLLTSRFASAERSDVAGWLAPLKDAPAGVRTAQAAVLDRMTRMAVGDLRLVGVRETTAPVPVPPGTAAAWDVRASLTYRLRGFDSTPRTFDLDLTFTADPARPAGLVLTATAPSGRPQPWDLDGLVVRRSAALLVLAVGSPDRVDEVVRHARTAASRVRAAWGSVRPAVWVAPATDSDAARLLGRTAAGLTGVAAATDGPLTPGRAAGADRIVLVPGVWTALRPEGRAVVMTHELTHVTVRASTTRAVPLWLSEGYAELVAYDTVRLPEATVVAPALEQVRAEGLPQDLPADADFEPGTSTLPAAYGLSLLAVRTLADAYGRAAVVRLYRAAAGGQDVPTGRLDDREAAVDAALRGSVGTTRPALVRDWQARIRALLR